ncbi:Dps family protein [Sphingomonas sp. BK345]|uniref:Dps family protein n=1 Tax=Sphingomonas sp. BK345 TaxID=2586980 RepID=UPI00161168D6|nr:DNA starvation/stationary phase protection protein [Sphingomonas sp. BK345]MBB3475751.1 starvation-inducible DNA-binding protein [Sphingomonas sp. BK345]
MLSKSSGLPSHAADEEQPSSRVVYREIQSYGTLKALPIGLEDDARAQSVEILNQVLADTMTLRDMYKKHHWQMSGATFYQLHLLLDKHFDEQSDLVDTVAERIMALGGISIAMAPDVAEMTRIPRPPRGREDVPSQLARLLEAHEMILRLAHDGAKATDASGDDGTNDLLVSNVVRTNEPQVWFLAEHLAATELLPRGG